MSSITSVGSSTSSNAAAAYQENLARMLAQKQASKAADTTVPAPAAPAPAGDVDHDGDSH